MYSHRTLPSSLVLVFFFVPSSVMFFEPSVQELWCRSLVLHRQFGLWIVTSCGFQKCSLLQRQTLLWWQGKTTTYLWSAYWAQPAGNHLPQLAGTKSPEGIGHGQNNKLLMLRGNQRKVGWWSSSATATAPELVAWDARATRGQTWCHQAGSCCS